MQIQYNVQVIGLSCNFMTVNSQQKLMKMDTATKISTTIDKNQQNNNLAVSLLELILTKKDFHTLRAINEIFKYIKESTKKTLINKTLTRLLGLEFKSDNIRK